MDNAKNEFLSSPEIGNQRFLPDSRDMKKWQGQLQMCHSPCTFCFCDGAFSPLISSRWQLAKLIGEDLQSTCIRAEVTCAGQRFRQMWILVSFSFFFPEWIIPSLTCLLMVLSIMETILESLAEWVVSVSSVSSLLWLCEGWVNVRISGKWCLKCVLPFLFTCCVSFLYMLQQLERVTWEDTALAFWY